ncbi:phosphohydrolase [Clostridium paridis]|uniref:Phosphohydrolase n=1 Tax=Clostridium paridis TaxID=2803863 RepID=A0A937FIQ9_9CLOT|nr:phosphohydrolase [Clostridium paridis]MBL4933092.1 phosphohydrolase [Clostridium paridis]
MQDYILTYSKTKFYPLDPIEDDIKIIDIAHALSMLSRANGHFKHFYSVAQHSINCYKEAKFRGYSERVQLGCLLHDASESYISDLTRPVKKNLPGYFKIEEKLQGIVYKKFGVDDFSKEPYLTIKHDFSQRDFSSVENEFIYIFNELSIGGIS